jgi:hypothetical protein
MCWQHTKSAPNATSYYTLCALIPPKMIARLDDEASARQAL